MSNAAAVRERRAKSTIGHIPKPKRGEAFWNPEYAEAIAWYPKSPEAWAAWMERKRETAKRLHREGKLGQKGIPHAFRDAEMRLRIPLAHAVGREEAEKVLAVLRDPETLPTVDNDRAELALRALIEVLQARDPETGKWLYSADDRTAASKVLLTFTQAAPVPKGREEARGRAEGMLQEVLEGAEVE